MKGSQAAVTVSHTNLAEKSCVSFLIFFFLPPQVTRIDGTVESCPCLRVTQRSFGSQNSSNDITFYRLSMPIECSESFSRSPPHESFFSQKRVTSPQTCCVLSTCDRYTVCSAHSVHLSCRPVLRCPTGIYGIIGCCCALSCNCVVYISPCEVQLFHVYKIIKGI